MKSDLAIVSIINKLLHSSNVTLDKLAKDYRISKHAILNYIEQEIKYKNRNKYYDIKYRLSRKFENDQKLVKAFKWYLESNRPFKEIVTSCGITEQKALKVLQDMSFTSKNLKLVVNVNNKLKEEGVIKSTSVEAITKTVLKYFSPKTRINVFASICRDVKSLKENIGQMLSTEMYQRFLIANRTKSAGLLEFNRVCFNATYNNNSIEEELEYSNKMPDIDSIDFGFLRFCSPCLIEVLNDCKNKKTIKNSPLLEKILNETATNSEWLKLDAEYSPLENIESKRYYTINVVR